MISVFVSSTFRDMQGERDVIRKEVLPEIRSFCRERDENIGFIDLRWGVDTSKLDTDSQSKKVLNVCLDQIDRCKPYIIVILGQRYGWVPDYSLIRGAVSSKQYLDDGADKSVTALEIEYGALSSRENADKYLFFFREDLPLDEMPAEYRKDFGTESPLHAGKLKDLKEKIVKMFPDRVFSYSLKWDGERLAGYEDFGRMVTARLREMIGRSAAEEAVLTRSGKRLREHRRFIREQDLLFAERGRLVREITASLDENRLVILSGAPGTGKTALASHLASGLQNSGTTVIPVICGYTADTASALDVTEAVLDALGDLCGETEDPAEMSIAELKLRWAERTDRFCSGGRKLVIILDGLDRLAADDLSPHLNFLPARIHESCSIVVTCREDYPLPRFFPYRAKLHRITNTGVGDAIGIIGHLMGLQAKELDAGTRLALTAEKKSTLNPLYLSLMLRRIVNMDNEDFRGIARLGNDMSAIRAYMTDLVRKSPDTLDGAVSALCGEVARSVAPVQTEKILRLIALSSRGIRQDHLQEIFSRQGWEWSELDFARLQKYMYGFVSERERGRFDFAYPEIRSAVLAMTDSRTKADLCRALEGFLKDLPDDDLLKTTDFFRLACEADDPEAVTAYLNRVGGSADSRSAALLARSISLSLASGCDEWFGRLLARGISYGADFQMVNFITNRLIPDMRSAGILGTVILNLGAAVAENTARLALTLRERAASSMGGKYGSTMRVTLENMADRFRALSADVGYAEETGFALGNALTAAGGYSELQGDWPSALRYNCEALRWYRSFHRTYANDYSAYRLAGLLASTGNLFLLFGLPGRAADFGKEALDLCAEALRKNPPDGEKTALAREKLSACRLRALDLLCRTCEQKEDLRGALEWSARRVSECQAFAQETNAFTAWEALSDAYEQRGVLLQASGDPDGAEKELAESGRILPGLAACLDHYESLRLRALHMQHAGSLALARGDTAGAAEKTGWSVKWFAETAENADSPENRRNLALSRLSLAAVKEASGSFSDAEACYESSGEILEDLAPAGCPARSLQDLIRIYQAMGNCMLRQGLAADSRPYFAECDSVRVRLAAAVAAAESKVRSWLGS